MPDSFPDTASSAAACGAASTRRPTFHWLFTSIADEGTHAPQTLTPAAYAAITKPEPVAAQAA